MKTYFFKIIRGYNLEDYIEIDHTELEKALYCFLEKKDAVYSGGAVRGREIIAIQPDYHRQMGWNRGYKLERNDFEELADKGLDKKLHHLIAATKEKVLYLVGAGKTDLIGKNVEIPGFAARKPEIRSGGMKSIGDILPKTL